MKDVWFIQKWKSKSNTVGGRAEMIIKLLDDQKLIYVPDI